MVGNAGVNAPDEHQEVGELRGDRKCAHTNVNDQNRINDEEWARPENWNALGIYRSALDTRTIVPKRNPRFGVTVNLGHRNGRWTLLGLSIVPLGFLLLFILYTISK